MNLHNQIMNIQTNVPHEAIVDDGIHAYKLGHRDARHAAAELSLKAESYIDYLEELACSIMPESELKIIKEAHFQ